MVFDTWGRRSNTNFFLGSFATLLVFSENLSDEDRTNLEGYLACKYQLQDRLAYNHLYRNSCVTIGQRDSTPTVLTITGNGTISSQQNYDGRATDGLGNPLQPSDYLDIAENWSITADFSDPSYELTADGVKLTFNNSNGFSITDGTNTISFDSYELKRFLITLALE